ncbi:MAG: hypothetical protein LBT96_03280 [Campylobacteraceae bacterium]|jgi:hypothetical protein|nr:hypothetical protein [Campylobacteraceae bacterium]
MKIFINFLAAFLSVLFLAGCGGSGSGSSGNDVGSDNGGSSGSGSTNTKCTNPNQAFPSFESVFPVSLFGEPYQFGDKGFRYTAIGNTTDYIQKLTGYGIHQNEPDYVTYEFYNPYVGIQFSEIAIYSDNYIKWRLAGATDTIDDSLFDNATLFPPTGTQKDLYETGRTYTSDMTNKFNGYITELEKSDFKYEEHWEGWIKYSEDKCFLYHWYKGYSHADWQIYLNTENQ